RRSGRVRRHAAGVRWFGNAGVRRAAARGRLPAGVRGPRAAASVSVAGRGRAGMDAIDDGTGVTAHAAVKQTGASPALAVLATGLARPAISRRGAAEPRLVADELAVPAVHVTFEPRGAVRTVITVIVVYRAALEHRGGHEWPTPAQPVATANVA